MPNAALPKGVRNDIESTANRLADRVLSYSLLNFPLDVNQIELAITEGDTRDKMRALQTLGVEQPRTTNVNILLDRAVIPNLKRSVIVNVVELPRAVFVPYTGVYGSVHNWHWGKPNPRHRDCYTTSLEHISDDTREALGVWANNAVRSARMCRLVSQIVSSTIDERRCRTVGHLQAWWPALCRIYDNEPVWIQRLRNPPTRNLRIYEPSNRASWLEEAKLREAAEHVFAMASTLPVYSHPKNTLRAMLARIESLEGDSYIPG